MGSESSARNTMIESQCFMFLMIVVIGSFIVLLFKLSDSPIHVPAAIIMTCLVLCIPALLVIFAWYRKGGTVEGKVRVSVNELAFKLKPSVNDLDANIPNEYPKIVSKEEVKGEICE